MLLLADDIAVHIRLDLLRRGKLIAGLEGRLLRLVHILMQQGAAQIHTLIANIDIRTREDRFTWSCRLPQNEQRIDLSSIFAKFVSSYSG